MKTSSHPKLAASLCKGARKLCREQWCFIRKKKKKKKRVKALILSYAVKVSAKTAKSYS